MGDRVELAQHDAPGVVLEVLARDLVRTFRDGCLEVHDVGRYHVLLASGRTVVVNDRGGRLRRLAAPAAPPPPPLLELTARRGPTPTPSRS
ncbi:MAG: hypothetical protein Q7T67_12755 [Patulibacter sp.]|nr:hypothetical protein [Patulibacter sp.]